MSKFLLTFSDNVFLIIGYLIMLLIIAFRYFKRNDEEESLFSCKNLFIMFYYVFLAVGPIYAVITKKYSYNYNLFLVFGGSLLLFLLGTRIAGKTCFQFSKKNVVKEKKYNWDNIKKNSIMVLFFSYACALFYLFSNLSYILQNYEDNRVSAMTGNGALIYFSYAMIPATLVLYYCHFHHEKIKNIYFYYIVDVVLLLFFGFRSRIFELILLSLIIRNDYKRIKLTKLIKYGIFLILSVSLLQAVRMLLSDSDASMLSSFVNTLCVASINLIYIFRVFPTWVPFQHGYTYLINFQQLLPSSSIDMTMWLKKQLNMQFAGGGVTPTIIGEFFINFGWIGVVLGLIFTGFVCQKIDNYARIKHNNMNKVIYFIVIFYLAKSVSGGISNFIIIALWFVIVTFCIFKINFSFKSYQKKM